MSDKGVHNKHQGQITVSARAENEEDIVLVPGYNRLTSEQYRQIKAVPVVQNYFKVGLLQDAAPPPVEAPKQDDASKPLDKMNKAELRARAAELGLAVADDATNAQIVAAITAATAQ